MNSVYRFLIIDDEPIVRDGISTNIDWAAHGFELVGACRDGREGIQAIERLQPDVVLTDICMPFVDGLELAGWIGEQYPGTKTILLTGYDEFEYAQEAVRLKVSDFLLKPITADELRKRLDSIRTELDSERLRRQQLARLHEQLQESLPVLRERFLNRLIRGPVPEAEARRKLSLLDLGLPGPWYSALVCDSDGHDPEDDLGDLAVQNSITDAVGTSGIVFSTHREEAVVLLSAETEDDAVVRALETADAISTAVVCELGGTVSIGVGDPVSSFLAIPDAYATARIALEHRLVLGPNHIITVQQVRGISRQIPDSALPTGRARFVGALKTGNTEDASAALRDLLGIFDKGNKTEDCHVTMHRVLADSLNALETLDLDNTQITGIERNPFEQLARLKTLDEIFSWFLDFHEQVRRRLEERRQQHSMIKAVAAEQYIRDRYTDFDLSVTGVCSALSISKSYFSPLFKTHTGMTFVEYLTRVRIERARELLASQDLRSYEIAEQVGFRDAHYFSLTFKKQTGYSPTEYREMQGKI